MEFVPTAIAGAFGVRLKVHSDSRGRFKRHYCEREFAARGLASRFVQMNHSVTLGTGSVRGMHFQRPPSAEDKLVTYLKWAGVELDESRMFYIPKGCAHGFQNLAGESHLIYLMSDFYAPETECGVRFDDPALSIGWPLPPTTMSERDLSFPLIDPSFEGLTL
jgi:dTDP-4-dehydrorhamnose 3,5-epimerase